MESKARGVDWGFSRLQTGVQLPRYTRKGNGDVRQSGQAQYVC